MARYHLASAHLLLLTLFTSCQATTYIVGGTSGWDVSANLQTWAANKVFNAGDVLWFQYSRYHNVNEVDKFGYDNCNATNAILTGTIGNTNVTLKTAGASYYFISGKPLYCFGGMRLQVQVQRQRANAAMPQAAESPGPTEVRPDSPPSVPTNNSHNLIPPVSNGGFTIGARASDLGTWLCVIVGGLLWAIGNGM